jgi:hypothetical protein
VLAFCAGFWALAFVSTCRAQTMPPIRYQHPPDHPILMIWTTWAEVERRCGHGDPLIIGCEEPNLTPDGPPVIIEPEPCEWARASGERRATLDCHELAHVNAWPADHPK